jgi:amino acid transporter
MATQASEVGLERRVIGLPTAIAATFGLITATTIMISVAQGFFASYVFLVALFAGLLTMYLAAMSFSELATMIPKAGSMNEYVRAGLGPFFATLTVAVGYIAIVVFPGSAEGFASGAIIDGFLWSGSDPRLWVVIIVGFLAVLNLLGIRAFATVEIFLTFTIATSLLVMGVVGLIGVGANDPIGGPIPHIDFTWSLFSTLLGLAIFTFVGVEYTCPLAEELRNPRRDIPWGIFIGLTLVAIPVILYGLAAVRYVPGDQLAQFSPVANMDVGIAIFGSAGKWWMGFLSIAATLSTLNAVAAGVPRILYGMALTRQLPRAFGYLTPATRAPAVGILLVTIAPIIVNYSIDLATSTEFIELILAGVLGWATAYFLIHLTQIVLRLREPGATRPYRSPAWPLPQLVGMGLLALAAFKIFPDPEAREDIYIKYGIFVAIAVGFAVLYNLFAYRSVTAVFKPVPLGEVYRETEVISAELPPEIEPGLPHIHHDEP